LSPQALAASATEPKVSDLGKSDTGVVRRSRFGWLIIVVRVLAVSALSALILYRQLHANDVVQGVWSAVLDSTKVAVICNSEPIAYRPKSNMDVSLGPEDRVIPVPDAFIGTGDALALADVVNFLGKRGKEWQLLPGDSTPSDTLLAGPIILVGVHANKWTPTITKNLRFFFGVGNAIYDRSNPRIKWSLDQLTPDWKTNEDYALVSRFTNPGSGQPVICDRGPNKLRRPGSWRFPYQSKSPIGSDAKCPKGLEAQELSVRSSYTNHRKLARAANSDCIKLLVADFADWSIFTGPILPF